LVYDDGTVTFTLTQLLSDFSQQFGEAIVKKKRNKYHFLYGRENYWHQRETECGNNIVANFSKPKSRTETTPTSHTPFNE